MQWWEELDGPLLGRYEIERTLGQGGMAEVWLARDIRFDSRKVAIKAPNLDKFPADQVDELLARFHQEVKRQANDSIFGTVRLLDAGEVVDARGVRRQILVMDYLAGGSLGTVLGGTPGNRAHTQTLAEVNRWLPQVAATLDRLHARKILHRDVKPDNLLFDQDGNPFLADLGIATSLDDVAGAGTLATLAGTMGPGSPGYQAPETLRGEKLAASDQFSLAVTVYEALAGALPMPAYSRDGWIMALANWQPKDLALHQPSLPAPAAAAVMRALAASARERFLSCSEFAAAMVEAMHARPSTPPPRPPPPPPHAEPAAGSGKPPPNRPGAGASNKPAAAGASKKPPRWVLVTIVLVAVLAIPGGFAFVRMMMINDIVNSPEWETAHATGIPWIDARTAHNAVATRLDTAFNVEGGRPSTLPGRINVELDLTGASEKAAESLLSFKTAHDAWDEHLGAFMRSGGDKELLKAARADLPKLNAQMAELVADAKTLSERTSAAATRSSAAANARPDDPEATAAELAVGQLQLEVDDYSKAVGILSNALAREKRGLRDLETKMWFERETP